MIRLAHNSPLIRHHWIDFSLALLLLILSGCNAQGSVSAPSATVDASPSATIDSIRVLQSQGSRLSYGTELCKTGYEMWSFEGEVEQTVDISVLATEACGEADLSTSATCFDSLMRLYQPSGELIAENDNYISDSESLPKSMSRIHFVGLPMTGEYRLEVSYVGTKPSECDYSVFINRYGPEPTPTIRPSPAAEELTPVE